MLPARRKPKKLGNAPKREFPRHRKFVRSFVCVVTTSAHPDECEGEIECCHYRTAANSGEGLKPADWWCFPGCEKHHREQHQIGQPAFERKYGLNLAKLTARFAEVSPDTAMKETMRQARAE